MEVTVGNVLLGKYRVDEVLGTGGMGKVLRAWHLYLQQPVAIKVLLLHVLEDATTVQLFLREAQATVKLRSEHIARVMDVATLYDGTPIMVMEYLEGDDLNQIVRAHGPQSPHVVVDLMLQACEGIAEAHAMGIVHRDIKPSNFFVTRRIDNSQLLKILDFGISKAPVGQGELTGTQSVVGTPTYMAPEQMKHARSADMRSDIWSMGIVMYQLIEGRPPFQGESFPEVVYKVTTEIPKPPSVKLPVGLSDAIMRCVEKEPTKRPQNAGELAKLIAPFASDPVGAALSAERAMRILATRGSQPQVRSKLQAGSPQPLTPNSGSVSQHGSGQVTVYMKSSRAWIVAGALSLVIIAGAGGFIANEVMHGHGKQENTVQMSVTPSEGESGGSSTSTSTSDSKPVTTPTDTKPAVATTPPPTPTPTPTPSTTTPTPTTTTTKPATPTPPPTVATTKPATPVVTPKPPTPPPTTVATKPPTPPPTTVATKPPTPPPTTVATKPPTPKPATPAVTKPATPKPATTKPPKTDDGLFDDRH